MRLIIGILILAVSSVVSNVFSFRFFEKMYVEFPRMGIRSHAEVLDLIAWSGFIVPSIIWLFYRGLKIKNPYYLMICLGALIIIWVGLSPTLWNVVENTVLPWLEERESIFTSLSNEENNKR